MKIRSKNIRPSKKIQGLKIEKKELKSIYGGPTRRAELDHVGTYSIEFQDGDDLFI